jgi:hypothetical protein
VTDPLSVREHGNALGAIAVNALSLAATTDAATPSTNTESSRSAAENPDPAMEIAVPGPTVSGLIDRTTTGAP